MASTVGHTRLPSRFPPQSRRAPAAVASSTQASTRRALASSIIGPHTAFGSSGEHGSRARARSTIDATNASATRRCTYSRCTLMHTCPA